ncbi:MAG: divergent PAP2 family protein [Spirochaetales bacterium]|nr:divergent PAP2 family protein [Spirochaetales bacterium]
MDFFANKMIWSAFWAMVIAQVLKVVVILIFERRIDLQRIKETGGMPSSHSATVAALTTTCGILYGVASPYFAICIVFGSLVIHDATGVRRAAGEHAVILNNLVAELSHLLEEGKNEKALKTLLGHTYPQVLAGTVLGVLVGFFFGGLPEFTL